MPPSVRCPLLPESSSSRAWVRGGIPLGCSLHRAVRMFPPPSRLSACMRVSFESGCAAEPGGRRARVRSAPAPGRDRRTPATLTPSLSRRQPHHRAARQPRHQGARALRWQQRRSDSGPRCWL
eukprot:6836033-Prymnesium_polylepis.2